MKTLIFMTLCLMPLIWLRVHAPCHIKNFVAYISANYHWQKVLAPIVTSKDITKQKKTRCGILARVAIRSTQSPQPYCITLCRVIAYDNFYCHAPFYFCIFCQFISCLNVMHRAVWLYVYLFVWRFVGDIKRISTLQSLKALIDKSHRAARARFLRSYNCEFWIFSWV